MKIHIDDQRQTKGKVQFCDVEIGTIFEYEEELYLKTSEMEADTCFCFTRNEVDDFWGLTLVKPLKAILTIKE